MAWVDDIRLIDSRSSVSKADKGKELTFNPSPSSVSKVHLLICPTPCQPKKGSRNIQADIFGNCSGMASLIPSKPPSLPFSPDLLAYAHPQVPNTGYLESLKSTLPLPELAHVLMLLPASWNAMLW